MDLNVNLNVTLNGDKLGIGSNIDKILDFFRELFLKKEVPAQLPTEAIRVTMSEQKDKVVSPKNIMKNVPPRFERLLDALKDGPMTAPELRERLGISGDTILTGYLNPAVALGLVERMFKKSHPHQKYKLVDQESSDYVVQNEVPATAKEISQPVKRDGKKRLHKLRRLVGRFSDTQKADLLEACRTIAENYPGKTLSRVQFGAQAIKFAEVPVATVSGLERLLKGRFDFASHCSSEVKNDSHACHEAAVLLMCGISVGITEIITEQALHKSHGEYVRSIARNLHINDQLIDQVYKKYQKDLKLFNIDKLVFDVNWEEIWKPEATEKTAKEESKEDDSVRRLPSWTRHINPEQLTNLCDKFNTVTNTTNLQGDKAIAKAIESSSLTISVAVAKQAMFHHKHVPGYTRIEEPVQNFDKEYLHDPEKLRAIRSVKFCSEVKNMSAKQIAAFLGFDFGFVDRIIRGITFGNVLLTGEDIDYFKSIYQ